MPKDRILPKVNPLPIAWNPVKLTVDNMGGYCKKVEDLRAFDHMRGALQTSLLRSLKVFLSDHLFTP